MVEREDVDLDELLDIIRVKDEEIYRLRAEVDHLETVLDRFIRVYTKPLYKFADEVIDLPDDPIATLGIAS